MTAKKENLSRYAPEDLPSGTDFTMGIAVAEWNEEITDVLHNGAVEVLREAGVAEERIHSLRVPGTFELPTGAKWLSSRYKTDAVLCLGCVIKGETDHNEYINQSVSSTLCQMGATLNKPFIFGVLTTDNIEQAKARASGKHGNKGVEAAVTALKMADLYQKTFQSKGPIGFQ